MCRSTGCWRLVNQGKLVCRSFPPKTQGTRQSFIRARTQVRLSENSHALLVRTSPPSPADVRQPSSFSSLDPQFDCPPYHTPSVCTSRSISLPLLLLLRTPQEGTDRPAEPAHARRLRDVECPMKGGLPCEPGEEELAIGWRATRTRTSRPTKTDRTFLDLAACFLGLLVGGSGWRGRCAEMASTRARRKLRPLA